MGIRLLHFKAVHAPPGVEFQLPVQDPRAYQCFDIFSSLWVLKPRRQINWRVSFALKGARYEDYALVTSKQVGDTIRHIFTSTIGITSTPPAFAAPGITLVQQGDPDARLQGDVVTFVAHAPVIQALVAGAQSFNCNHDEIGVVDSFEWITSRKGLAPIQRMLERAPDDHFLRQFKQFFTKNWTQGRSFVQIIETA